MWFGRLLSWTLRRLFTGRLRRLLFPATLSLAVIAAIIFLGPMAASESPAPSALVSVSDLQLSRLGREVFGQDKDLAPLNLGVTVKDRVARLTGDVPSHEVSRQAEQLLRKVPGILEVQNDLRLILPEDERVNTFTPLPSSRPPLVQQSIPPQPRSPGALTGQSNGSRWKPRTTPEAEARPPLEATQEPAVILPAIRLSLPPANNSSSVGKPFHPEPPSGDLAGTLERLRHLPPVREATIFGQSVHVLADERATAADLGLRPEQVRDTEPSLEDVFVTLSKAAAAKAA